MATEKDRVPLSSAASQTPVPAGAVFLSYASEDAVAAERVATTLREAGIEVWIDKSELRGGDAWDQSIRKQIKACALFIPIISRHAHDRIEGYFRLEWKLAVDRSHLIAPDQAFLLPVAIDDTPQSDERIPDRFRELQWTCLPAGQASPAFIERVRRLLLHEASSTPRAAAQASLTSTAHQSGGSVTPTWRSKAGPWVIGALLAVALAYFVVDKFWLSKRSASPTASTTVAREPTPTAVPEKSIAVLPFVDLSEKHDQEYFADGMAEEILDLLAKVPELTVIGRTSSFQFKNRTEDLRTIGARLKSAYVVEGSVRKAGERIRVTAQLIDTRSGTHVWSESYDRNFGDVLKLQDEIATSIARALRLTVEAHETHPLRSERAAQAYTLYLKGQLAADKFEVDSTREAQNSFEQALALDPTLVAAAEALAQVYIERGENEEDIGGREAWEHAKDAAEKALQLDTGSAIAHGVLGYTAGALNYDWATAESEFRKAFALNPNDPQMLANRAEICAMHGDYDEAVQRASASVAADPLNAGAYQVLGLILYLKGDYPHAESALRKSLSINPGIDVSHEYLGLIELVQGQRKEALKEFAADPESSVRDTGLALVNHALGKKAESDAALARVVHEAGAFWPYGIAFIHAYRGERDQAFEWLEKAYAARDVDLMFLQADPLLMPLHTDPRWSALMKKMNLPE